MSIPGEGCAGCEGEAGRTVCLRPREKVGGVE